MNGYEDINDNVKTQNGAWMTSWLSDHTEKGTFTIPDDDKDTVKISTWLLILFLRYHGPKISYRIKVEKLFLYYSYKNNFSLEVICHADKLGDMLYACTERIAHMKWYGYDFKYYV